MDGPRVLGRYWGKVPVVVAEDVAPCDLICLMQYTDQISMHATARLTCDYGDSRKSADPMELGGVGLHAWVGQIVTFFATAPLAATWAP